MTEKERLDQEEEEVLAKLLRLRKQKRALEGRVRQAFSCELRDVSELEQEEASAMPAPSVDSLLYPSTAALAPFRFVHPSYLQ